MHGRVRKPTTNPIILFRRICRKYGLVARHLDGNRFKLYDVKVKVVGYDKLRNGVILELPTGREAHWVMCMLDLVELFAGRYMLTRNEVKQLAEIKCNDLYYYCNKCDRKHKLATKIGRKHVEYADAIHCRCGNVGKCDKYDLRFDFGYTLDEVYEALEALGEYMFANVGKMLKTLEDILDGGEFDLKVGVDDSGYFTLEYLSLCLFEFRVKVKVEEVDEVLLREDLLTEPSKYLDIYSHIFDRLPTGVKERYKRAYENWKMVLNHPIVATLMIDRG